GENYFSPLKIYEYLAAGLPIVASAVGSIPAVLEGTDAATLVPADDTGALSAALQNLIDDAEVRHRMGAAARSEALAHHSWTSRCQEILEPFVMEPV
ncbi:MAG: glycosyltransferase, partial [Brevibacterium aurantiacum]